MDVNELAHSSIDFKQSTEAVIEKLIDAIALLIASLVFIACWIFSHDTIMALFNFPQTSGSSFIVPVIFPLELIPYVKLLLLSVTSSFISMILVYQYFGVKHDQ